LRGLQVRLQRLLAPVGAVQDGVKAQRVQVEAAQLSAGFECGVGIRIGQGGVEAVRAGVPRMSRVRVGMRFSSDV